MKKSFVFAIMTIAVFMALLFVWLKPDAVPMEEAVFNQDEMNEFLEELPFEIKLPTDLPDTVAYSSAHIVSVDGEQEIVALHYEGEQNSDLYVNLSVSQQTAPLETQIQHDANWDWKEVEINGKRAYMGASDHSTEKKLTYDDEGLEYNLTSTLEENDLIQIIESLDTP